MRRITKNEIVEPFRAPLGESIFEMIGKPKEIGGTTNHSLAYVEIPSGKRSPAHYHKVSEETYFILKGSAEMTVDGETFRANPGLAITIMPGEVHTIINDSNELLEFLTVSAPAWVPDDSFDPNIEE